MVLIPSVPFPIPERRRGGYKDYWLAADALEWTSHGYGGFMFDADNNAVTFDNKVYRVDFMTDHLLDAFDQLATTKKKATKPNPSS